MLPSDINLKIRLGTVGYNNKILVSDSRFSLGKNLKVNTLESETPPSPPPPPPVPKTTHKEFLTKVESHKNLLQKETITHKGLEQPAITHEKGRTALILFLTGGFTMWFMFR